MPLINHRKHPGHSAPTATLCSCHLLLVMAYWQVEWHVFFMFLLGIWQCENSWVVYTVYNSIHIYIYIYIYIYVHIHNVCLRIILRPGK
jgi:hypothetical protein